MKCLLIVPFIFAFYPISTVNAERIRVDQPDTYSYKDDSVSNLRIRGSYGRYLIFIGRTLNQYQGTRGYYNPGSPGTVNCSSFGYTTSCYRSGYVAPSYTPATPGGIQNRDYLYELDCRDLTFDRKGDYAGGYANKGWMSVNNDPVAETVANKYCPIISKLPKVYWAGKGRNKKLYRD